MFLRSDKGQLKVIKVKLMQTGQKPRQKGHVRSKYYRILAKEKILFKKG
jgi:hypothetical protein